jgi:hypothetical protein
VATATALYITTTQQQHQRSPILQDPKGNLTLGIPLNLDFTHILTGVSESRHPSTPPSNKGQAGRPKGRKGTSNITDSAKKRKRQEHNKKGNERKRKEKKDFNYRIVELEGRLASLSGWATEKIVMSSKVEAAEAAAKTAQQKQSEAEELSTKKGFDQALCMERQKLKYKEALWSRERAALKAEIANMCQISTAVSRSAADTEREKVSLAEKLSNAITSEEKASNLYSTANRLVRSLLHICIVFAAL